MAYTQNPHLPRVRMEAVRMVQKGRSIREIARHLGYSPGAVHAWVEKAKNLPSNAHCIPTESSRPHHYPRELSDAIVFKILEYR